MNKLLIFLLLCSFQTVANPVNHKKVIKKTTMAKIIRHPRIKDKKMSHTKKKPKRVFDDPSPPNLEPNLNAYKINDKRHKSYTYFHQELKKSVSKVINLLPKCFKSNMRRSCAQHLFVAQQWIDAYLQNDKIKKCKLKVRADLKSLNLLLVNRVLAAQAYSEPIIRKFENSQKNYYSLIEEKNNQIAATLPSCF